MRLLFVISLLLVGCGADDAISNAIDAQDDLGSCSGGNCTQTCPTGKTCQASCSGGACKQSCPANATCNFDCSGGRCTQTCAAGAHCNFTCTGNLCHE